jgi:hypothetical protein
MTENANKDIGTNVEYTGQVWMNKDNMGSIRMNGKDKNDVEYSSYVNFYVSKAAVSKDLKIEDEKGASTYVSMKGFLVPNVYTEKGSEKEVKTFRLMVTEFEAFVDKDKDNRPKYKNEVTQKGYANNIKAYNPTFITGYSSISNKDQDGTIKRSGISVIFAKDAIAAVQGSEVADGGSLKTTMKGFFGASKPHDGKPGAPNFIVTKMLEIEVAQTNDASKGAEQKAPKQERPAPSKEPLAFNPLDDSIDDIPF